MQRGDVYRFKIPKGLRHEQQGVHYGVVLQAYERLSVERLWSVDEALTTILGLD